MDKRVKDINTSEHVIRKPMFWPIFLLIMFLIALPLCLWKVLGETPPTSGSSFEDTVLRFIESVFYSVFGFSIWIPLTIVVFVLLVINSYIYFRFKLVIHELSFSVTPLWGETHEVAFSAVQMVTHSKWSRKGHYIVIKYNDNNIRIPYTTFKQKSIDMLLRKFKHYNVTIVEESNHPFF